MNTGTTTVASLKGQRLYQERGDVLASIWPGLQLGNIAVMGGAHGQARQHYASVLRIGQDNNLRWAAAKAAKRLGNVAILTEDYSAAKRYLLQSLRLADELGLVRDVVSVVYDLASVEMAAGGTESAVRLLAAIHDHPQANQTRTFSVWSGDKMIRIRDLVRSLLTKLEAGLPAGVYDTVLESGRTSDLGQIVVELLDGRAPR